MNTTVINNKILIKLLISFALCAALFFAFFVRSSDAAVTSWMSPSAIGESAYSCYSGSYVSWTNHANVYTSNNSYASVTVAGGGGTKSYGFQITGFGFSVTAGSRIDGVEASVEGNRPTADNYNLIASIQKNGFGIQSGSSSCSYPTYAAEGWSASESVRTFGASSFGTVSWGVGSGMFGYPLTAAQVNMSDFGIALWVSPITNAGTWNIDHVQMRVYYTAPPTASGVSASYGSYTRTGSANSPWTLNFTAAGGTTNYQVRTGSTSTTGTQVITGVAADGANAKSIAYNASGIVDGSQTLYLYLSPDNTFWSPSYSFTLLRDTVAPTASTTISTTPSTPTTTSYTVTFTPNDAQSTNANEIAYQIRTAAGGAGTLLTSGTSTNNTPKTTASFTDSTLVSGANTRYIRTCDGANNCTDTSFTVTYAAMPVVTTPTNTGETNTTAVLGGNITSQGGSAILSRGICYSVTATNANPQNGGNGVTCVQDGANTATGIFSQTVTGLTANTNTYSYTAYATNTQGTGYSPAGTFRTYGPPSTTTSAAGSITANSAILNSTINPNGGSTNVSYLWGTTVGVACNLQPNTLAGPTALTGTANLSGATTQATLPSLSGNTTYYFCVMATNSYGTNYGSVTSFTTSPNTAAYTYMDAGSIIGGSTTDCLDTSAAPCPPTISSVGSATQTSLTVNWSAATTSGPAQTSFNLFYCDRTASGACTPSSQIGGSIASGSTSYAHNATITCNRTYAYLIRAVNATGASANSNISTGTTSSCASVPSISAQGTGATTATTAYLTSSGNSNGASTTLTYRYGTSNVACSSLPSTVSGSASYNSGAFSDTSLQITGLTGGTTYYYCATANNSQGTTNGVSNNNANSSFATPAGAPSVTTGTASSITNTGATLQGTFVRNGGTSNQYRFRWGTSNVACTSLTNASTLTTFSSDGSYSIGIISGLSANTTYYWCAYATNSVGPTSGSVLSFITTNICNRDADGDGYGTSSGGTATCGTAGYVADNTDCYDVGTNAALANPGQASYQYAARGDGSFDYNCNNSTETTYSADKCNLNTWQYISSGGLCSCNYSYGTYYCDTLSTASCGESYESGWGSPSTQTWANPPGGGGGGCAPSCTAPYAIDYYNRTGYVDKTQGCK